MVYFTLKERSLICQEKAHTLSTLFLKSGIDWKKSHGNIRRRIVRSFAPKPFFSPRIIWITKTLQNVSIYHVKLSQSGENDFSMNAWTAFKIDHDAGDPTIFPPEVIMEVKALACELPKELGLPFSRLSHHEIAQQAVQRGIVASISDATVWRWLSADAIKPWSYRSWIWPRDPNFSEKAEPVLDLYQAIWQGKPLGNNDYVICADEKTSIQARKRIIPGKPSKPNCLRRVEFEYKRTGALAYLAAWDVQRARVLGFCNRKTGIEAFHRLVDLVMNQELYRSANRVFWITDNASSHRGDSSVQRLSQWYKNAIQIHTPVHASWLNQIEIYFSVVQRKVLTPNEFNDLDELEKQLLLFQAHYEKIAKPFEWKFTKRDLKNVLQKLSNYDKNLKQVA
jgi:hypothetical protein